MVADSVLVVLGLACPPETWRNFLGTGGSTRIVPISEVISKTENAHPLTWAKYIREVIVRTKPSVVVAHDIGLTLTLLAILRLKKTDPDFVMPKIILFNGAFRGFNVLRNPHPIWSQFSSAQKIKTQVLAAGGEFDSDLNDKIRAVRSFYRYVIANSLRELALSYQPLLNKNAPTISLPIMFIRSDNDRFISTSALNQLENDFDIKEVRRINYGHFPYSSQEAQSCVQQVLDKYR